MRTIALVAAAAAAAAAAWSCAPKPPPGTVAPDPNVVRVYTSLYPSVIDAIKGEVNAQVAKSAPGVKVEWVQGGSERIRRRLAEELASGVSPADVLLTSDPSHYRHLRRTRKLVPYESPNAASWPAESKGPDGAWATARYSVMVLGVAVGKPKPKTFDELVTGERKDVSIGDPSFSGTNLMTVARLTKRYGWTYYEKLKERGVVVAGSNSTVMERLETSTTHVGIVLLENVLASRAAGSKVQVAIPTDLAVVIPGHIALLPHAAHSNGAKAVYDAILSPAVQKLFVKKGFLHSGDPKVDPPDGAPSLEKLLGGASLASVFEPVEDADEVGERFGTLFAFDPIAKATDRPSPTPAASPAP